MKAQEPGQIELFRLGLPDVRRVRREAVAAAEPREHRGRKTLHGGGHGEAVPDEGRALGVAEAVVRLQRHRLAAAADRVEFLAHRPRGVKEDQQDLVVGVAFDHGVDAHHRRVAADRVGVPSP